MAWYLEGSLLLTSVGLGLAGNLGLALGLSEGGRHGIEQPLRLRNLGAVVACKKMDYYSFTIFFRHTSPSSAHSLHYPPPFVE